MLLNPRQRHTHALVLLLAIVLCAPTGPPVMAAADVLAAELKSATLQGWEAYAVATRARIDAELRASGGFLALDFQSTGRADRAAVLSGSVVVRSAETTDRQQRPIEVPDGMVHHWRGAVFIPGATVGDMVTRLQSGVQDTRQEDVLQLKLLERRPDHLKVYLKLQRSKFVTVVYNTEHDVNFTHYGPERAASASTATKIAELDQPNTPEEREKTPGHDRGFLWRWHAYWRYEAVKGGVIAECESVSLSRDVPSVARFIVQPLINSTARESMDRTLGTLRGRFQR